MPFTSDTLLHIGKNVCVCTNPSDVGGLSMSSLFLGTLATPLAACAARSLLVMHPLPVTMRSHTAQWCLTQSCGFNFVAYKLPGKFPACTYWFLGQGVASHCV
jgi:hypothetical protein